MRAFYYFDLASVFANIPIIDKPLGAEDKNAITKADKADVQKFILSDLDAAINGNQLPKAQNLSADELGRITHEAALSFRARVKMFFGDYEGAKSDLKAVVEREPTNWFPTIKLYSIARQMATCQKRLYLLHYVLTNPLTIH